MPRCRMSGFRPNFEYQENLMQTILAVDTAASAVSAALLVEGQEPVFRIAPEQNRHTECLIPLVDEVLKAGNVRATDVTHVAFGAGPGAFTGIRVACAVAQGLSWAWGVPTVPVSNLTAAATAFHREHPDVARLLVALDARMHECYVAGYVWDNGRMTETMAPALAAPGDMAALADQHAAQAVTGSGLKAYAEEIALSGLITDPERTVSAREIAFVAQSLVAAGKVVPAAQAAPLYVRDRVALTIAERAAGEKLG